MKVSTSTTASLGEGEARWSPTSRSTGSGLVPVWRCARPVRGAGGSGGWRCRSRTGRPRAGRPGRPSCLEPAAQVVADGHKDAFAVAGLLVEDAAAGAGLSRATGLLVAEALGLGWLPGCEPFGELLQVGAADSGQAGWESCFVELGSRGAGVGVQERVEGVGGGEADGGRAAGVAVVLEGFTGLVDGVADAGGGDLQQVGEHGHGAHLPLVAQRDQQACGIVQGRGGCWGGFRLPVGLGRRAGGGGAGGPGRPGPGPGRWPALPVPCWSCRSAAGRPTGRAWPGGAGRDWLAHRRTRPQWSRRRAGGGGWSSRCRAPCGAGSAGHPSTGC